MIHVPQLIIDLALILGSAGIVTLIFKKLKQPLVLGYIIAGLLVGPNFKLFPSITDVEGINIWAEIGVIFLLFSLGLEFSFKKLVKVGGSSGITASVQIVFMIITGFATGKFLGWSFMDSIFLGAILSMSSTTIILRAFDELGIKSQKFAGLVFGALVIEDLVAILLMVLLSTLAVSQQFAGEEMLISVIKLSFFLVLWFLAGIFLIPTFLKRTRHLMNDETLLIVSVALCLLMVILATEAGFSPALGAFIMGSIIAETVYVEKIEHLIKSIKELFGAVFFVSVGMLINPEMIVIHIIPVLIITFVTIFGKSFSTLAGALVSGQPLKQSVQSGMSLAQIGEFSFIIATLGLTLKVTSDFLYPIAVAVSAITTLTTPYFIRLADPTYNLLERILPRTWLDFLNRYSSGTQIASSHSDWREILRSYVINVVVNSVIIIAIIFLSVQYLVPFVKDHITNGVTGSVISLAITLLALSPFIWGLAIKRSGKIEYTNLWFDKAYGRIPLILLELLRGLLALFFIGFLLYNVFGGSPAFYIAIAVVAIAFLVFSKGLKKFYNRIEKRFLENLNERESLNTMQSAPELLPWDAHLSYFTVSTESDLIGKTLQEIALRERYGVNIALIERGRKTITTPGRDAMIFPMDKIAVIGSDEQLEHFRTVVEPPVSQDKELQKTPKVALQQIIVDSRFLFLGKSIRESGIREKINGLIVGIERQGKRILNPDSHTVFEAGDIVWIVGSVGLIKSLLKEKPVKQNDASE